MPFLLILSTTWTTAFLDSGSAITESVDSEGEFRVYRDKRRWRGTRARGLGVRNMQAGMRVAANESRSGSRSGDARALCGAQRVHTKCFFVSGISLDCCAEDIKQYCKSKSVNALGCNLLRSHAWGMQSAKLFVADTSSEQVLLESFWPRLMRCRPWERDPPWRSNLSTQHAED